MKDCKNCVCADPTEVPDSESGCCQSGCQSELYVTDESASVTMARANVAQSDDIIRGKRLVETRANVALHTPDHKAQNVAELVAQKESGIRPSSTY